MPAASAVSESKSGRLENDELIAVALATGSTIKEAAEKANCCAQTVQRRRDDPKFQALVQQYRRQVVEQALGVASKNLVSSVEKMVELSSCGDPQVECRAAKTIIDLAVKHDGPPPTSEEQVKNLDSQKVIIVIHTDRPIGPNEGI